MAFEREKKNVSIGNMPIVAPASSGALAKFAENVQTDLVNERSQAKKDSDNIFVAQSKALMFDSLTQISLAQETPSTLDFAKEAKVTRDKVLKSAENNEQRQALQVSFSQIVSSYTNQIAQKEAMHYSNVAIGDAETAGIDIVDIHKAHSNESSGSPDVLAGFDKEIDVLAEQMRRQSQGRVTPSKAKLWARNLKGEMRENVAFNNYMDDLKLFGKTKADENLGSAAKSWAKTDKENFTFRKSVKDHLNTMEVKGKIKSIFSDTMIKFEGASHKERINMLPAMKGTLPEELYAKSVSVVEAGNNIVRAASFEAAIDTALLSVETEEDANKIEHLFAENTKTARDKAILIKKIANHKEQIISNAVKKRADEIKIKTEAFQAKDLQMTLRDIKMNGAPPKNPNSGLPSGITTHYSNGEPITKPSHITAIESAITSAMMADNDYTNWVSSGRVGPPSANIQRGINNNFNKSFGPSYRNFLETGDPAVAENINEFININKVIPAEISNNLKFNNLVKMPSNEIANLASLIAVTDGNQEKNSGVVRSLGNLDPETRIFLNRFSLVPEEKRDSYMNNYQEMLIEAKNNPAKMGHHIIAAEITAAPVEGEVSVMEKGFVDYVADSTVTDVWKSFTNHLSLEIPVLTDAKNLGTTFNETKFSYMDTYMRRVNPTLFLEQNRSFKHGMTVGIFGVDVGDVQLHLGKEARKYLGNQAAQTYIQTQGVGTTEELSKIAWEKTAEKIGYSVLQKPTFQGKGVSDNNVIQAFIPELTSGLSVPDTAIVMIESIAAAWNLSGEAKGNYEFKDGTYKTDGKIDFGKLFDAGKIMATSPLPQKNGKVLHKLMIQDESMEWKIVSNFSSANVAASDYFDLGNSKILKRRTTASRKFDGSGD
jgi:hypothetical protein